MLFIVQALDRPDSQALRTQARVPHLEFVAGHTAVFRFGGPLLGADGRPVGSLMILDLPDRVALEAHLEADPFFGSGLFQTVQVWQSVQVVPEATPGALRAELDAQRRNAAAA
ncbi:YciI family protein [Aquabacterium sp.]|uniref:YciI family protein n=1 Tax=Aquabacterium sp. TaxID=1872578 RepID=UPI00378490E2